MAHYGKGSCGERVGKNKGKNEKKVQKIMPFEKYSPKQKKLARIAVPRDKITAADLEVLRGEKKIPSVARKARTS